MVEHTTEDNSSTGCHKGGTEDVLFDPVYMALSPRSTCGVSTARTAPTRKTRIKQNTFPTNSTRLVVEMKIKESIMEITRKKSLWTGRTVDTYLVRILLRTKEWKKKRSQTVANRA